MWVQCLNPNLINQGLLSGVAPVAIAFVAELSQAQLQQLQDQPAKFLAEQDQHSQAQLSCFAQGSLSQIIFTIPILAKNLVFRYECVSPNIAIRIEL